MENKSEGYIEVTDVLDLHGTPMDIIPEMIDEFIKNAVRLGLHKVRIIHGKGKSRLKYISRSKLSNSPHVIAFYDAPPEIGGWGATIVELTYVR